MAAAPSPEKDAVNFWNYSYESGRTGWHRQNVHEQLVKYYNKLNPDDKARRVLVTMCGMSVDMTWLADKGLEVIGVDIAEKGLRMYISDSGCDWEEAPAPKLEPGAKIFTRKDRKIKLYCGDVLKMSAEVEGKFDAIYDCNGLHAIERAKTAGFAKMIKSILNPGGRLLLEAIEYDPNLIPTLERQSKLSVPPPHSMNLAEMKSLFEPECTVEAIDSLTEEKFFKGKAYFNFYLIIKKS